MKILDTLKSSKLGNFIFANEADNQVLIKSKQRRFLIFVALTFIFIGFFLAQVLNSPDDKQVNKQTKELEKLKIKTSKDVLNQDQIWNEYFENKIAEEKALRSKEKNEILDAIKSSQIDLLQKQNEALDKLKSEIDSESDKLRDMVMSNSQKDDAPKLEIDPNLSVIDLSDDIKPKDLSSFIPPLSFAPAKLLAGISVPTGATIQSDPFPVIMQITGNLITPCDENIDLQGCRIGGSCYGDLSNERAIIRLETLSCVNKITKAVNVTKITGYVVGPDGLAGIRGKVISMDKKHVQNALIGSMIAGLGRTASDKNNSSLSFSLGDAQKKQEPFLSKLENNTIFAAGEGSETLAKYFVKKAESIREVIEVPIAADVAVVFNSGVYFNETDSRIDNKEAKQEDRQHLRQNNSTSEVKTLEQSMKETRNAMENNRKLRKDFMNQKTNEVN